MTTLTRSELLEKCKRVYQEVKLPSGGTFRLRSISEREFSDYQSSCLDERGNVVREKLSLSRRRLIVLMLVDDSDALMFNVNGDLDVIAELNAGDADFIYEAARKLSGLDKDDVEARVKNSSETHDDA